MFKVTRKIWFTLLLIMITESCFNFFRVGFLWKFISVISSTPPGHLTQSQTSLYQDFNYDDSMISRTLWPNDSQCSSYTVRFVKNFTTGYLLTFPRSGNSWTRYLLEAASGVFTSSIYNSKLQIGLGYYGEQYFAKDRNTIINKTHNNVKIGNAKLPVVIIIRNPARSIVSLWNFKRTRNRSQRHTFIVNADSYNSKGFPSFVQRELNIWYGTYARALSRAPKLHVVFYEKLREDPLKTLRGIFQFLKVGVDEERLSCLSIHLEGDFKGGQREVNPYSQEETDLITNTIIRMNELLKNRGFPALPDYTQYVN